MYSLDVKTYQDSNGDGMGDIPGLISRLDHLQDLGITCLWLLPFFPSPLRDNGYDVSDYMNVDPRLGTLDDIDHLIRETDRRGIRVLVDLVINHTSIEHPWFKDARSSRNAKYRDYYVWHDDPDHHEVEVEFDHAETSVWEYTPETGSYYLHRFYKEQPDLNLSNPAVRQEILRIMEFWVLRGITGFRVDAAHMITDILEVERTDYGSLHAVFGEMRAHLDSLLPEGVLMGEANVGPDELMQFFNNKEGRPRMHMLFNFIANKYTMLAFARQQGTAIEKGLRSIDHLHAGHWVNFVRHHDELNTDMLTESERREVFAAFAPKENMLALHGPRRRLPPMLGNDRRRIELMYNLVFSMHGTPLLNYGEEIGMGDDLSLQGRFSVRTPMQWNGSKNAGFSTADREKLYLPVISSGDFAYQKVNVENERNDQGSLLRYMRELIALRKSHPVIGHGKWRMIQTGNDKAVAILHNNDHGALLAVHNLSGDPISVRPQLDLSFNEAKQVWPGADQRIDPLNFQLTPYASRWIELKGHSNES